MKNKSRHRIHPRVKACLKAMAHPKTDPNGSYTGIAEHPDAHPTQDADDL